MMLLVVDCNNKIMPTYQFIKNQSLSKLQEVARVLGYRKEGYEELSWVDYSRLSPYLKSLYVRVDKS